MHVRTRNEFLEGNESEDELETGYDSDRNEESRGEIAGRSSKRRRFESDSDAESLDEVEEDGEGEVVGVGRDHLRAPEENNDEDAKEVEPDLDETRSKLATPKQVAAAQKAARRTGVIYISRVPPFMKPQTLKHFLTPHAPKGIGRIFLTPEDHAAHSRRVKSGGNKKKSFTDGWVEFISKRDAKIAAETLNGNIIGGKKGNFYHDDLWSMKYLKGFKWSHLTEQIANENAERAARLREEVRKTKQENKAFVADVERGKMLEGMETKRKAKQLKVGQKDGQNGGAMNKLEKQFKQKVAQKSRKDDEPSEQATRMQKMIF